MNVREERPLTERREGCDWGARTARVHGRLVARGPLMGALDTRPRVRGINLMEEAIV